MQLFDNSGLQIWKIVVICKPSIIETMIGERLKCARLQAGLSLRDLARMVGVTASAISKYERGLDMPGSAVLLKLSRALNVSTDYFLRPITVTLSMPEFRCIESKISQKEIKMVMERVRDWIERYLIIENLVGYAPVFKFPEIEQNINKVEDVETVADNLRQAWNLGDDPIDSLISILEAKGIKIGLVPGSDNFDALTVFANEKIPVICVKENLPGDRQRLSIAHELGHLLLKMPDAWSQREKEKASFRFGAAFLAPKNSVIRELGIRRNKLDLYELHDLKHQYGISMQALIYRARDLGIIDQNMFCQLNKLFRKNNWHSKEPGCDYPAEKTSRFERLVLHALSDGLITQNRAATLLGKSIMEFAREVHQQHGLLPQSLCS